MVKCLASSRSPTRRSDSLAPLLTALQSSTFPFLCVMFEVLIVCTLAMIVPPHRQPAPGLQLSNSTAQPAIYTRYARPFRKARKAHRPEVLTAGGPHGQRSSRPERGPHGGERGGPQRRRGTAPSRVASCMSTPCLCHPAPWRRQSVLSCTPSSRHEGQTCGSWRGHNAAGRASLVGRAKARKD